MTQCRELARRGSLALTLLLVASSGGAHEEEEVRYLRADGVDSGGCRTPATACRSVGYTAGQAGKGGEVKVAAGQYTLADRDDLFYVWSEAAHLSGGYRDDFHHREPEQYPTLLIGVPPERRASLEARGFQVVVDTKWSETEDGLSVVQALAEMLNSSGPEDCIAGEAGGFACDRIDLLSHVALGDLSSRPTGANDVWGFKDLNTEREYALLGLRNGVAVIDVSEPTAPFEVGTIPGQQTGWRDIKVLQYFDATAGHWVAYAYVTADAAADHVAVIDLTELPHRIGLAGRTTPDRSAHNLFIAGVDLSLNVPLAGRDPVVYLAGSNLDHGAFRGFSLHDPLAPGLVSRALTGYMHDGTSTVLHDPAQAAGCPSGRSACEVLADFNEDRLQLWDVTLPAGPQLLSTTFYAGASYVHSGSWSENARFLFLHDEYDERDRGLHTTLYVFDAAELAQPVLAGTWSGTTRAIDHNGYPRGNRYYISNYTRGLTVLDITDPAQPVTAGYFDTFPLSDNPVFSGAWGVYPFLPSRTILVSDIESGLFVLRDGTLDSDAGSIRFARANTGVRAGQPARLTVSREGGADGAVSVGWEVLRGSVGVAGEADLSGRLDWSDGDSRDLEIEVPGVNSLPGGEVIGRLFVRLFDPQGGATLGEIAIANVFVDEPGVGAALAFSAPPTVSRNRGRAFLVVERRGSTQGEVQLDFATRPGSAEENVDYLPVAGTLSWEDGDGTARVIEIDLLATTSPTGETQFFVEFSNPTGALAPGESAVVTIAAGTAPPPPPPPPAGNNGGGGAPGAWLLLALAGVALGRRARGEPPRGA
jgi:choice-of-anchor B domain-containing protein